MRNMLRRIVSGAALIAVLATLGLVVSASPAAAVNIQLNPGQQLNPGEGIFPTNQGCCWVTMDTNGNLSKWMGNSHVWLVGEIGNGIPGTVAQMQTDGNFVLRAPGNVPIWASGTNGNPGTVAQMQDDGALALYKPGHIFLKFIYPPGW